eukprot:TRINITY_DN40915_c0_g1_i1.p1 TRINITY_DN40915_c0_g1~~TRINITY_DN40915_c0_g1_i1.p1  ORF type:complete len:306 (+),score=47.77 TRINITY_DN40915_c0_g1_i1:76-918(+)
MSTPIKRARDMTREELQSECKKLKRKVSGTKADLLQRLEQVKQTNDRGWAGNRAEQCCCHTYLASGEHRNVYWGYYTKGPRKGEMAVKKIFKTGSVFEHSAFDQDLATAEQAASIMRAFNSHNAQYRYVHNPKFNDRKRFYLNMPMVWTAMTDDKAKCLVEPMIPGLYVKMNSNTGWVKDQNALTEALSHFSFDYTGGQCLLCDLQGNEDSTRYLLTDPAIHSVEQKYGPTDGGEEQMKSFFEKHRCNAFCDASWRRAANYKPMGNGMPSRMGTSFFFRR